ncbi:MAG: host-nuclease inhibitor Gam family protein [Streptococcaceae bacterium]|jgi:inosine-uridine nucleoside N-ribohydrolase|nr:host-nuclease inhibitor Gam family protein [Streptococcaceae bacterium]
MTEEKERFKITNDSTLNWALEKYKEAKEQFDLYEQQATESKQRLLKKIAEIDLTKQQLQQNEVDKMTHFDNLAAIYLIEQGKKTIKTINGSVRFKKKTTWNYDATLLDELKEKQLNDFIRVKTSEEVDKKGLKAWAKDHMTDSGKVVTEDGELIAGVTVEETQEFEIKI